MFLFSPWGLDSDFAVFSMGPSRGFLHGGLLETGPTPTPIAPLNEQVPSELVDLVWKKHPILTCLRPRQGMLGLKLRDSPAETTVPPKLLLLKTYCCSRPIAAADLGASREGSATCAADSIPIVTQSSHE